jgi:signal transduction histidine kinase
VRSHGPGRAWSRLSLRWRLLVLGVAGLSLSLLLGGWLLLAALGWAFDRSVDASARQTTIDVAALIDAGQLPEPVPVAGAQLVQVVDGQSRVRAGSAGVDRLVPLLQPDELGRARSGRTLLIDGGRAGLSGPLRVSAVTAGPASDPQTVIVAVPLSDVLEAVRSLRVALLAVFAPLVAGLAVIAWWVIGRTLQPVEALRAGAEEITGQPNADADQRLPVPPGRDEIQRLAVTLNGMLDRLGTARRRQRQFVADAAHELRNPLAGMRTQLEVARRHPTRMDWQELTEDLLADTERLAALADDLLLLARVDDAEAARRPAVAIPVGELLATVATRYREARVSVEVLDGADGLLVRADAEDLHRVLTNLVDNAVRYARSTVRLGADAWTAESPVIRQSAGPRHVPSGPGGLPVRICVTDDGPGIPEADRERVFARFTRLDDARADDEGGAGLGLAIVAELVHRHGGTVRLTDAGPGLRAEVLLPRCE